MFSNLLHACRRSIQVKLFLSLTAIVAIGLTAMMFSQAYLVQDYFIRQAEANLRSSNYLLSRVLADPLFAQDLTLLQARLHDVQNRLPLCNFQLKDDVGTVVYRVGEVGTQADVEFDPNSRDGCYNTILPVVRDDRTLGTVRMGVRTDDIARARSQLMRDSAFFSLFWFAIFMLPFFIQIRRMINPIGKLSEAAQQIANGNLDFPAPPPRQGEDEVSQLTTSFQAMSQALLSHRDEQAANLAELNNEKSTLDALLSTIPVGVIFADRHQVRYCNKAFSRIFALSDDDSIVGIRNDELLLRLGRMVADADLFLKTVAEILEKRTLTESAYFELKDGRTLRMISNTVISSEDHNYLGRFWLFEDATEEKKRLQLAEMRGEQDALTLLYNRRRFDQDLQRSIAQAERDGSHLAVLMFDLDDFKPINDQYGHACGDIVLREVAKALTSQLRRNEVLYRVGGDEFSLLLLNTSDDEVLLLAERIIQSVHDLSFDFDGATSRIECSLGIAKYPEDAQTLETLLERADQAMYVAKQNGKGQYSFSSAKTGATKAKTSTVVSTYGGMNLGIAIMDAQHLSMANYIQGILDAMKEGDQSAGLRKRISLLLDLCRLNHQTEEDLMQEHGLPGMEEHRADHQKQVKALEKLFAKLNLGKQELTKLSHDINEWLMEHIREFDTVLAEQLRSKGGS